MLVLAENFEGWGKGNWGDLTPQIMMESHIDKMAIVGDETTTSPGGGTRASTRSRG